MTMTPIIRFLKQFNIFLRKVNIQGHSGFPQYLQCRPQSFISTLRATLVFSVPSLQTSGFPQCEPQGHLGFSQYPHFKSQGRSRFSQFHSGFPSFMLFLFITVVYMMGYSIFILNDIID